MKSRLISKLSLWLLLFPAQLFAQDITGIWKGDLYIDSTKQHIPYEISISEEKGKFDGFSHIVFTAEGVEQMGLMKIKVKQEGNQVMIEDDGFIVNTFVHPPPKEIKKTMLLIVTANDSIATLAGTWKTNHTMRFYAATGTVTLQHTIDYKATALYKKLDELKLTNKLVFNEPQKMPVPAIHILVDSPKEEEAAVVPKLIFEKPVPIEITLVDRKTKATLLLGAKPKLKVHDLLLTIVQQAPKKQIVAPVAAMKPPAKEVVVVEKPKPVVHVVTKPAPIVVAKLKPIAVDQQIAVQPPVNNQPPIIKPVVKQPETQFAPEALAKLAATDAKQRGTNTIQSVYYTSDSLTITLYDDGYIDGDTVSVLLDGKVFIANHRLTTDPNGKVIYINKNTPDSMTLVMYAENLGSIPPNTGLMVVHDGDKAYEVRFTTDLQTNAAIILRRKKEE